MTLQQLLLILRARANVVLFTLLATVLAALVVSLVLPKQYTARTAVVIDVKSPDPIAGTVLPGMISPSYMATQVDIIASDRVAERVVKALRMDEDPAVQAQWQETSSGRGDITAWLAGVLKSKLDVKPSRESNVINVSFAGTDPVFVARVANAFAQAYIDVSLGLKVEPARQNSVWFDEQVKQLRDRLEAAQKALSAHQQKTGIVTIDETLDFETAKINELSTQLTVVQGQTSDSLSKSKPTGGSETLAEVIQNPLINSLKTDIARLESRLQESNVNLGKNHPQTQRAESELASLRARLSSETRKIVGSIDTTYRAGLQRESALRDAIERQRTRVLALNKQRDELNVLKRDVEQAQRAFEGVSQRATQTRLESLSVQTNAVVLNPASEPTEPSTPKTAFNLLISVFLGLLLGTALALILELSNRRVRSADDLADIIGLPVLASIGGSGNALVRRGFSRRPLPRPALAAATSWTSNGNRT